MFRLTHYVQKLLRRDAGRIPRSGLKPGPVVIWNLTRRCNLKCGFCYAFAANGHFPGELDTEQALAVVNDLAGLNLRMLILSGGEPLMRLDWFTIAQHARSKGIRLALSTNGCLINTENIEQIAQVGFNYVGISLDGIGPTHDAIRGEPGSFDAALRGIRLCRDKGLKVGVRFTLTEKNRHELEPMLDLVEAEGVGKFYLSHLNYAGRGGTRSARDVAHRVARETMELLFDRSMDYVLQGTPVEIVTGNNDADGTWFLTRIRELAPDAYQRMRRHLLAWGGNATGENIANIDNLGRVHPDSMWWSHTLGNVREQPFSKIWAETQDPFMLGLRSRPRPVKGRCGTCPVLEICNGNTRTRAGRMYDDPWAQDPGCYLTDRELAEFSTSTETAHAHVHS